VSVWLSLGCPGLFLLYTTGVFGKAFPLLVLILATGIGASVVALVRSRSHHVGHQLSVLGLLLNLLSTGIVAYLLLCGD
jgi:hypothetical protein